MVWCHNRQPLILHGCKRMSWLWRPRCSRLCCDATKRQLDKHLRAGSLTPASSCGLAALLCLHSCSNPAPGAGPLHLHPHRRHPAPDSQLHPPPQSCDPCTAVQRGSAQLPDLHVTDSSEAMLSGRKPPFRLLVRAIATDGRPIRIRHAVSEGFVVRTAHLGPHCRASQCLLSSRDRGLYTLQCTPPRSSMCRDWPLLPGPCVLQLM